MFQQTPACTYTNKWWWTACVVGYLCWLYGGSPGGFLWGCGRMVFNVYMYVYFFGLCAWVWVSVCVDHEAYWSIPSSPLSSNVWLTSYYGSDHRDMLKDLDTSCSWNPSAHILSLMCEGEWVKVIMWVCACVCVCARVCVRAEKCVWMQNYMDKLCPFM